MEIQLPFDLQSEQFLLGRMLVSVDAANEAIATLKSEDFFDLYHQSYFGAMKIAYNQDLMIEPATIAKLVIEHFPKQSNAMDRLLNLHLETFGDLSEVRLFIQNIKKASDLRSLIRIGQEIISQSSRLVSFDEIQSFATKNIENLMMGSQKNTIKFPKEILQKNYQESNESYISYIENQMEKRLKGESILRGIPTGFLKLDDYLSGLAKGHFIIIGARPGVGKSTFVLNLIHKLTMQQNVAVGFFSIEMSADEVLHRLICIETGIESEKVERGWISHGEFQDINQGARNVSDRMKLLIDDFSNITISQVIARTKRMIATDGIKALFIDYLGLIRGEGKFGTKQEEVSAVSKSLRALAKECAIPIICICQLNRASETENRIPKKSDLRESGQIEADAHSIMMLDRPSVDNDKITPGLLNVLIVKNRFGKEGVINFGFQATTGRFEEIDKRKT